MSTKPRQISLPNHQATENLGYLLGKYLPAHSTIFLKGDLGAGKTTLVQGIGKGLDIKGKSAKQGKNALAKWPDLSWVALALV